LFTAETQIAASIWSGKNVQTSTIHFSCKRFTLIESKDHRLADTDLRHGVNHRAFVFLVAQRQGVSGIGVEENGIIVVWVTPKFLAKSSQLALDGLPCFRRQANASGLLHQGVSPAGRFDNRKPLRYEWRGCVRCITVDHCSTTQFM